MVNAGPTPASLATRAISRTMAGASSGTTTGRLLVRKSGSRIPYAWSFSEKFMATTLASSYSSSGAATRSTMSCTYRSNDRAFFFEPRATWPPRVPAAERTGVEQRLHAGGDAAGRPWPPCNDSRQVRVHDAQMTAVRTVLSAETSAQTEFQRFFEAEHHRLTTALYLITGDTSEAEELSQEAMVRMYERWDRVRRMDSPTGYLYRTALNL